MNDEHHVNHDKIIDFLCKLAPHTKVVRHEPGYLKVQVALSALGLFQDINLDDLKEQIPGILNSEIKLLSRSVLIEYDRTILPGRLLDELFDLNNEKGNEKQIRGKLRDFLENHSSHTPEGVIRGS
jgi:hypothetical protein